MKLYATVTSERASKGQGGEHIDIDIFNEKKDMVATIKVRDQIPGQRIIVWHDSDTIVDVYKDSQANKRGEKKKGECKDGCTVSQNTSCCVRCGKYYNRA